MEVTRTKTLANGVEMPRLGLGVWKAANDQEVINAVKWALEAGYRSIDTATVYQNESGVGIALKESDVPRAEIFVTTKVWNDEQGYESTLAAFENSLAKLQLDYVDLYLVHWPIASQYKETWRALEEIYASGRARAIGVSNFKPYHLADLLTTAKVKPMVNQVELHPLLNQQDLRDYCAKEGIAVEAWSPLGQGHLLTDPRLVELAEKYGKTPAQLILRWDLENDVIAIPKSVTKSRIEANYDVFDFALTAEDKALIDSFNLDQRFGTDPSKFDEA